MLHEIGYSCDGVEPSKVVKPPIKASPLADITSKKLSPIKPPVDEQDLTYLHWAVFTQDIDQVKIVIKEYFKAYKADVYRGIKHQFYPFNFLIKKTSCGRTAEQIAFDLAKAEVNALVVQQPKEMPLEQAIECTRDECVKKGVFEIFKFLKTLREEFESSL